MFSPQTLIIITNHVNLKIFTVGVHRICVEYVENLRQPGVGGGVVEIVCHYDDYMQQGSFPNGSNARLPIRVMVDSIGIC